jgi:ubiquitin-protein ligase E3 C
MNILKLPQYSSKETMRQKLLYAINAGAGFDLT